MVFGRLFGELAVSRAFGGRDFKKPKADNDWLIAVKPSCCYYYYYLAFFGAFGSAVTSSQDPEIQQVKLKPGVDQFLILACDGLWDKLTYQVILVRRPTEREIHSKSDEYARIFSICTADDHISQEAVDQVQELRAQNKSADEVNLSLSLW